MVKAICKNCSETFLQSGIENVKEADPFCTECDNKATWTGVDVDRSGTVTISQSKINEFNQLEFLT